MKVVTNTFATETGQTSGHCPAPFSTEETHSQIYKFTEIVVLGTSAATNLLTRTKASVGARLTPQGAA